MIQTTKPLKYVAINPTEALERAKKKLKENYDVTVERISQLQSSPILKELERVFKHGLQLVEPGEMTGSLRGRNAMHQQLETLFKGAKSKISIVTTSKGLQDLNSKHADLLKKVSSKGVKIRIVTPYSKENAETIGKLKGIAEVRKSDKAELTGRFCIIDNNHIVLSLTDEEVHPTQDLAFWTQSEHVAGDVFAPMFEMIWQKSSQA
jgi:sugar-specific transcriptional regulator TrmB